MNYYVTVKSNSNIGFWRKLDAKTLHSAKILATKEEGQGYYGDILTLVACEQITCPNYINDMPAYTKLLPSGKWSFYN